MGKRLWERMMKPEWVNDRTNDLVKWMIDTHDVYGRMARGLTEKDGVALDSPDYAPDLAPSYKGALSPKQVRDKMLEVNRHLAPEDAFTLEESAAVVKEIWKGDVSSVASLRWILPVADKLENMVANQDVQALTMAKVAETQQALR